MKAAASLILLAVLGGCSSHAQLQSGAGSFTSSGASISSSSAGMSVQASGAAAAALIGVGIAASVMQAHTDGVRYRANPFTLLSEPTPVRAPELVPARQVNEQDCTKPIEDWSRNLKCR